MRTRGRAQIHVFSHSLNCTDPAGCDFQAGVLQRDQVSEVSAWVKRLIGSGHGNEIRNIRSEVQSGWAMEWGLAGWEAFKMAQTSFVTLT